jgi:hypothetical protein
LPDSECAGVEVGWCISGRGNRGGTKVFDDPDANNNAAN